MGSGFAQIKNKKPALFDMLQNSLQRATRFLQYYNKNEKWKF